MAVRIVDMTWLKKRGRGVVEVSLDNATSLALDAEIAVRFQLKRGMELSDALEQALRAENELLGARQRLVRYLSLRLKTAREAGDYLARLGFSEEAASAAVEHARALGMINDKAYAGAYTRTQQRGALKGPRAIRHELQQRGVDRATAAEAVAAAAEPETQRGNARRAAQRKAASLSREEPAKARVKLMQYLLRKGYEGTVAAEVTRELLGGNADE